jgi:hypothetical protein
VPINPASMSAAGWLAEPVALNTRALRSTSFLAWRGVGSALSTATAVA